MSINRQAQLISVHSGLVAIFLMGIGLYGIAGWIPPVSPLLSAEQIAQIFQTDTNQIRFAGLMMTLSAVFFWPFAAAISEQMKRIEGPIHHPCAAIQLSAVTLTVIAIMLPGMLWLLAAYRPERNPEITQAINDFAWLAFVGIIAPAVIQLASIAYVSLCQQAQESIFPRWFGYFTLWAATGLLLGEGIFFFKSGPFAWNGLIAFWFAGACFFSWMLVAWYIVWQCIEQQSNST